MRVSHKFLRHTRIKLAILRRLIQVDHLHANTSAILTRSHMVACINWRLYFIVGGWPVWKLCYFALPWPKQTLSALYPANT
jgi:hypothetical protein